jgi:sugar phosphate isomerase/epimerase
MPHDVLWSATLGPAVLDARIEAAAANGYAGLTVRPTDLEHLAAEGRDAVAVVTRARDQGLEHLIMEGLSSWYAHDPPSTPFPSDAHTVEDHLRAAEVFGSTDCNVVAPFRSTEPVESLVEQFAAVCDRFAEVGVAVHLEFTPFRPIGSLATAWQIVQGAGRTNGGILFDTWHFFRGEPDLDLLASIPGDRILSVQVNDGGEVQESVVIDTFRHRRLPGDGDFDLIGALTILRRTGGLKLAGPEVLSVELDRLPAMEATRRATEAFDRVMAEVDHD